MNRTVRPSVLPWRALARVGSVLLAALPCAVARAGEAPPTAATPAAPSPLRAGDSLRIDGVAARSFASVAGATVRALPGTSLRVATADAAHTSFRLAEGTIEASSGAGVLDIDTTAFGIHVENATVFVRALSGGVYVDHASGSTGSVTLRSAGRPDVVLVPGAFRQAAFQGGALAAPVGTRTAPVVPSVTTTSWRPATLGTTTLSSVFAAPTAAPRAAYVEDVSAGRPVVPAPGPCTAGCNPCAPTPVFVPCAPPPVCTTGCGEMITHSGVPVPERADDAGRVPLGTALGARGFCNSCAGTECNRIPYVHYVEGLVCDVSTYKVGCCLITVRPASRVRVHRLPDGSLQMWAPNIGKDLALIEINDNQFGYIGEDGFLVIGTDCQIEYFRGLVHLYPKRTTPYNHDRPRKPNDEPESEDTAGDPIQSNPTSQRGGSR